MAIQQPLSTDYLNSPSHSLSHRVIANDDSAPAEAIVVDSAGKVGIGTTAPGAKLAVHQTGGAAADLVHLRDNTDAQDLFFRYDGSDTYQIRSEANGTGDLFFALKDGGNVGIGTTGPGNKLHIYNTISATPAAMFESYSGASPMIEFKDANATPNRWWIGSGINTTTDGKFFIKDARQGLPRVVVDASGNVGIGTNAPINKTEIRATADNYSLVNSINSSTDNWSGLGFRNYVGGTGSIKGGIIYKRDGNTLYGRGSMLFLNDSTSDDNNADASDARMVITNTGNVGIGTTSPTNILSLGGNSARTIWSERHTTANTAGNTLTIQAGGATSAATDKNGGNLILKPGLSTGTGESGLILQGCVAGSSGTGDNSLSTILQILGNKLGVFGATPVIQSTGWSVSNKSSDKVLDCNATSLDELADIVGTLVDTLKDYGLLSA